MSNTINQGFIELGYKQAAMCRENPPVYTELLVTAPSQRAVLFSVYNILVGEKHLIPIEELSEKQKREFWEMAKQDARGRLSNEKCMMLSRCLYVLDFLLSNQ